MQSVPSQVSTEIAAEESRPTLLYEIYLDLGTLRYAGSMTNITFPTAGNTYYAKAVKLSNIKTTAEGEISRATVYWDNVAQDMHLYNSIERFDGKSIIIKKIYRSQVTDASYYREVFNGFVEEPKVIDKRQMVTDVVSGTPIQRKVLQEYYQKQCNNVFGDSRCNYEGNADLTSLKASGSADSGSGTTMADDALTQADDYWSFGKIQILISGVSYDRRIIDFDAASDTLTFDVGLPIGVSSGDKYVLYKGCPLTWDACQATYGYGPSADNSANFNGYLHVGKKEEED